MATKDLKVDELRAQLAKRGLSTAGIKPTLVISVSTIHYSFFEIIYMLQINFEVFFFPFNLQVRRLEAAIRDESEKSEDSKSRKRRRDSKAKDADSEAPRKIKAIDELRSMNVKQLREKASILGVSAAGTKQELLEILSANDDDVPSDNDQGN